jgi:MFS family permease
MLWIAQFAANTGTWGQTVGAQWLMGDLGGGAFAVALVQTATTLPVFLLVVPAGALGDILDRRHLLLTAHGVMVATTGALAVLTAADLMSPALLLGLTAVLGAAAALSMPSFQAIQPELVPTEKIPDAALLNGANLNVARAVGPALGGFLIGAVGPEATFALNAVCFLLVFAALFVWERVPDERPLGTEHIRGAIVAGIRYIRSAPAFATVLARSILFVFFASSLWTLLPVVARGPLDLGASGYGILLGSVGAGAVAGAFVIPAVRGQLKSNEVVAIGSVAYAAALAVLGLSESLPIVLAALAVAGLAWIGVQSSLSASAQILLPNWTRARALAFFTFTFMGGQAIGSLVWGVIAGVASLEAAFLVAAVGQLLGPIVASRWLALYPAGDVRPARHWPQPNLAFEIEPDEGPVLIEAEWRIDPGQRQAFVETMRPVGRSRRRTGARLWGLFQDTGDPSVFVETFTTDTWEEHLRQHEERGTIWDLELETRARRFLVEGEEPRVRHLLWADREEAAKPRLRDRALQEAAEPAPPRRDR